MAGEFNGEQHRLFMSGCSRGEPISNSMAINYYTNPGEILSSHNNNNNNSISYCSIPLGLKHDTGLAVEWSVDEQYTLEEGLAKYANEPNIMRYIKIAALFHDKTVRDVALRCKWMTRKRRKQEDQISGKKVKDCKDILMESSLKNDMSSASSGKAPAYSLTTNHHQIDFLLSGVPNCTAKHLLEENNQAFGQISTNLSTLRLQDNINLFSRTRNNLITILNDMRNTPGIMSQMPPLPVLLNEELATSISPHSSQNDASGETFIWPLDNWQNRSQPMMFGSSSFIHLKQEPGC